MGKKKKKRQVISCTPMSRAYVQAPVPPHQRVRLQGKLKEAKPRGRELPQRRLARLRLSAESACPKARA